MFTVDLVQEIQLIRRAASSDFSLICFGHGLALAHKAHQAVIDFISRIESKYDDVA
jgi:hypothetical protein